MNNIPSDNDVERIKTRIVSLAELSLSSSSSYLMSRLGNELGDDLQILRSLTGQKLAEFIRHHLSDKYRIASIEGLPNIKALVRVGGEDPSSDDFLEAPPRSSPRFHYRFWAAFSVPAKATPRYLDPSDFVFKDLALGEDPPVGWLEISSEYIAPPLLPNRDEEIKKNIDRWLNFYKLEKANFLQGSAKPARRESERTLLLAILEALDRKQLQSVTMPLDVIAALLSKRI